MARAQIFNSQVYEDGSSVVLARLQGNNGQNVTQAVLSAITYSVFDLQTNATLISGSALTIANVIFDSLQTDARWSKDSIGYNFRHDLAASTFPEGNRRYRVEYKFTEVGGAVGWLIVEADTIAVRTS